MSTTKFYMINYFILRLTTRKYQKSIKSWFSTHKYPIIRTMQQTQHKCSLEKKKKKKSTQASAHKYLPNVTNATNILLIRLWLSTFPPSGSAQVLKDRIEQIT